MIDLQQKVMQNIILYASQQSQMTDIILWVVLVATIIALGVLVYLQQRIGKSLKFEIKQLNKIKKNNVEYEFVLKTMRLATWHIDPVTMEIVFDNDFRDKHDTYAPSGGETTSNLGEAMSEQDRQKMNQVIKDLYDGVIDEAHLEYQILLPHSPKKYYWSESYAIVAERDIDGKPKRIVGTSMRIDERKELEEALVEARNRAEESDRLKTAFLANMSHEIRTPLNAIIGFTSVIPDVQDPEERKTLLDLINENTQKLLRIIDDVVNISKVEAGKEELDLSSFDLNMLIEETLSLYQPKAKEGVSLVTAMRNESQIIMTDRSRLTEILRALLSNAVKFTSNGQVTIGYEQPADGRITIFVKDTGKGIAEEHQKRIFEKFYKVDEYIPGAGLGLSLCHTLAYSLGGSVTVESQLGKGSVFRLDIPMQ